MKKIIVALLILFSIFIPSVSGIDTAYWRYYKDIDIPVGVNEPVRLALDSGIMTNMNPDGSDLRVTENGIEIPRMTVWKEATDLAHLAMIVEASSKRPDYRGIGFGKENLIDGDYSGKDGAYYQIDSSIDPELAWFVVDLGREELTTMIKVWTLDPSYTWEYIMVEGSNDRLNWKLVKKTTLYPNSAVRIIIYPPSSYRYLKFTFWHVQSLVINEIEIYGPKTGEIVFSASYGKIYRVYYGNPIAKAPEYDLSGLYVTRTTPLATAGGWRENVLYNQDLDNDGILNEQDNCPLANNPDQLDSDNDGVGNACDNCPIKANEAQQDSDSDGIGDVCDNCPLNINPDQLDKDLDGIGWVCDDADIDGIINIDDNCIEGYNPNQADRDRNGIGDSCEDPDGDGVPNFRDNCMQVPNQDQADRDRDRIGDACDNCLKGHNPDQLDMNHDGIGDICEDPDNDGVPEYLDNCINVPNNDQSNSDSDRLGDACDNCPDIPNQDQYDDDDNGIGYICDDADGDGIINSRDNCVEGKNADQNDSNNDGIGDSCKDSDLDGIINYKDNCPFVVNRDQRDVDHDGMGDACDTMEDWLFENKLLLWGVMITMILVVGFFAYKLSKKKIE